MKGVSEVIAIILILMITISLAGLAYMFMSTTMSDVTASAGSTVDTTTSSMLTSFTIESVDIAKVYVRNTGQNTLSSLSVYVNDVPAHVDITPSTIAAGQVGTITIYDFIAEGDTIKITSPSGFSTSKKAPDPCAKAVGCWKLDEGSGTTAYDSSPNGNNGALINGAGWTSGKYGSSLLLDGVNDYGDVPDSTSLNINGVDFTLAAWIYPKSFGNATKPIAPIIDRADVSYHGYGMYLNSAGTFYLNLGWGSDVSSGISISLNQWHYIAISYSGNGTLVKFIVDNQLSSVTNTGKNYLPLSDDLRFGYNSWAYSTVYFNGTIDEVRIYDRAIY